MRFSLLGAIASSVMCCTLSALAGTYQLTDLGALPGSTNSSSAYAINSYGQVAGVSTSAAGYRAFLWTPSLANGKTGTMTDLGPVPGGTSSGGMSINSRGQVVGGSYPNHTAHAFLFSPSVPNGATGSMTDLGDLPGGDDVSWANAINDYGQVVGRSSGVNGYRAFLWMPAVANGNYGSMTELPATEAFDINQSGQITGDDGASAFLWTPTTPNSDTGTLVDIGDLAGGTDAGRGRAINNRGQIAGYGTTSDGLRAFRWTPSAPNGPSGTFAPLGPLPGAAANAATFASGVNSAGQVVGLGNLPVEVSPGVIFTGTHPFVSAGNDDVNPQVIKDLQALIAAENPGWTLTQAQAINDSGQIVGSGDYDPDGSGPIARVSHAVLLTVVPEPTGALLVAGGALLLARRSRRGRRAAA